MFAPLRDNGGGRLGASLMHLEFSSHSRSKTYPPVHSLVVSVFSKLIYHVPQHLRWLRRLTLSTSTLYNPPSHCHVDALPFLENGSDSSNNNSEEDLETGNRAGGFLPWSRYQARALADNDDGSPTDGVRHGGGTAGLAGDGGYGYATTKRSRLLAAGSGRNGLARHYPRERLVFRRALRLAGKSVSHRFFWGCL